MPWWGWLLISVLGVVTVAALALAGYLLRIFSHLMDGW
jgi:hypothetical protein